MEQETKAKASTHVDDWSYIVKEGDLSNPGVPNKKHGKTKRIRTKKTGRLTEELQRASNVTGQLLTELGLEASDKKSFSFATKKSLRDAPAASAITNATTIAELKSAWNTSLLGASPYA